MAARAKAAPAAALIEHRNEVTITGRLADVPVPRVLPSGDDIVVWRLIVDRHGANARSRVDVIDCTAWSGRTRRSAVGWQPDDVIEVSGALRRRFWRAPSGLQSRCEIEVGHAARRATALGALSRRRRPG